MKYVVPFRSRVAAVNNRLAAIVGTAMLLPAVAFAQEATFDPSTVTTKVTTYAGYALVILLAFAAAVWGLRAAGLIGRK